MDSKIYEKFRESESLSNKAENNSGRNSLNYTQSLNVSTILKDIQPISGVIRVPPNYSKNNLSIQIKKEDSVQKMNLKKEDTTPFQQQFKQENLTQDLADDFWNNKNNGAMREITTEYKEMNENIAQLEKLVKYQEAFLNECIQDIEEIEKEKEDKVKNILLTRQKIDETDNQLQQLNEQYTKEIESLKMELNLVEKEYTDLKNVHTQEEEKYKCYMGDIIEAKKKYDEEKEENDKIDKQIKDEEKKLKEKQDYLNQMIESLNHYQRVEEDLNNDIKEILDKKKSLNNELQELKGNIRVYCRIKPFLDVESRGDGQGIGIISISDYNTLDLIVPNSFLKSENNLKEYRFQFEHIFTQNSTQEDIFNEVSQLIQSVLDGYNVCIFAYGQTGSGKTYTMEGDRTKQNRGVIPRSVEAIFEQINSLQKYGWDYRVYVNFQEIYMEHVRDLISNMTDTRSEVSSSIKTYMQHIQMYQVLVRSAEEIEPLLQRAAENRVVAETVCNERSSRSHSIFQLKLIGRNIQTKHETHGTLNLIDLAGSERLSISKVEGDRLKETQSINRSLTALGDVITALANKEKYIPYRNSKLTHLLQNYLGGDSKTLMFVNISQAVLNFPQTLCSLRFAAKVKECRNNKPIQNQKIVQ